MATPEETLLRGAFAPARRLEPADSEVATVLARAAGPAPRLGRRAGHNRARAATLAILAILIAAAYAVPPTRAAINDAVDGVAGIFDGWGSGNNAHAPGRAVQSDEPAPDYFFGKHWADPRVIGEAGGYELFAYRERSGTIGFDLGDTGVGMGGYRSSDFHRPLCFLGPGTTDDTDPNGPLPYFGIVSPSAAAVELSYADGSRQRWAVGGGGFVVLLDRSRAPASVTALDAEGEALGSESLTSTDAASYC